MGTRVQLNEETTCYQVTAGYIQVDKDILPLAHAYGNEVLVVSIELYLLNAASPRELEEPEKRLLKLCLEAKEKGIEELVLYV